MSNFVDLPTPNGRRISAADLNAAFKQVDVTTGVTNARVGASGWLEAIIPATETDSIVVSMSPSAQSAGVFGTRASDNPFPGMGGFAIGAFAINDNTAAPRPMYGIYVETRRSINAGPGQSIETAIINMQDTPSRTPYDVTNISDTIGLLVGAGRLDVPGSQDCTVGLLFAGGNVNQATNVASSPDPRWKTGIIIGHSALRPGAHSDHPADRAVAMDMPGMSSITWRNRSTGNISGYISSSTVPDGGGGHIDFTDSGIVQTSHTGVATVALSQAVVAVTGDCNVSGSMMVFNTLTAHQGMIVKVLPFADNATARAGGVAQAQLYFNTTINAVSVGL